MELTPTNILGLLVVLAIAGAAFYAIKGRSKKDAGNAKGGRGGKGDGTEHF